MIDVNELESKWLNYKLRTWIPLAIAMLTVIAVLLLIVMFLYKNAHEQNNLTNIHKTKTPVEKQTTTVLTKNEKNTLPVTKIKQVAIKKEPVIPQGPKAEQKTLLEPSMDFLNSLEKKIPHAEIKKETIQKVQPNPKKNNIKINTDNSSNGLDLIVKRFQTTNDPKLSLFIAQIFYKHKDYKSAYNYSLITNEIDNSLEDSWIIFTKSLVKLGKKKMAISTLERYIAHSNSNEAKSLLIDIKTGKFQ